jgi:hypothetical protein
MNISLPTWNVRLIQGMCTADCLILTGTTLKFCNVTQQIVIIIIIIIIIIFVVLNIHKLKILNRIVASIRQI